MSEGPRCRSTDTNSGQPCQQHVSAPGETCYRHPKPATRAYAEDLTDKQRRFVEEYTVDFNATQAAIRAGYSEKTASQLGYQLLQHPSVSAAVERRMDELAMSADEALRRLAEWGRATPEHFLRTTATGEVMLDLSTKEARDHLHLVKKVKVRETRVSDDVEKVRTEIELHDAKDAVKQIAKVHGLFVDRVEHSGPDGGPIETKTEVDLSQLSTDDLRLLKQLRQRATVTGNGAST